MAYSFTINTSSGVGRYFDAFVESRVGFFDITVHDQRLGISHSDNSNTCIAFVDNGSLNTSICLSSLLYTIYGSIYTLIANTSYLYLGTGNSGAYLAPDNYVAATLGPSVTIIDEHGTHYGNPNCVNKVFGGQVQSYTNSGTIGVRHKSTNEGHTFYGWLVEMSLSNAFLSTGYTTITKGGKTVYLFPSDYNAAIVIDLSKASSKVIITAVYDHDPRASALSFDTDGGEPEFPSIYGLEKDSISIPTTFPAKEGYLFDYWESKTTGTKYHPGDTYIFTSSDDTLVAIWIKKPEPAPGKKIKNLSRGHILYYTGGKLVASSSGRLAF